MMESKSSAKMILGLSIAATALVRLTVSNARELAEEPSSADQARAEAPASEASSSQGLEEVIVTAQFRSQSLQKVPAAVTAVDGAALEQRGIAQLTQVTQIAPSLRISSLRSQTFIFLRGVGQGLSEPNADPQVAVNVNGVYVPSEMSNTAFFDVDRVEVVPGPQGTLYGRNSTGGVINLATRRPGEETSVNGFVEAGNYDRVQALVAADVPLTDTFAIRAAATLTQHDGYFTNGMSAQDTHAGRLTGVWRPDDVTTITAIGTYVHDGGLPDTAQLRPSRTGDLRRIDYDPHSFGADSDVSATMASLEVNRKLTDSVLLTYLGGYTNFDAHVISSYYPLPAGGTDVPVPIDNLQRNKSTTQELRLNISAERLESVLGAYYSWNDSFYSVFLAPALLRYMEPKSESEAVFGQTTYSLRDDLRVTGGVRYSRTKKSLEGANANPAAATVRPFLGEETENRLDWRAGVEFDVRPTSMLYANVQTGFTPGGFSAGTTSLATTAAIPFEKVTLLAYSAGMKNRLLDNTLMLNLEGFYYDYENYQLAARNPATLQNNVYNAQKAEIYGAQLDADLQVTDHDRLTLGVVYLHPEATRMVLPAGVGVFGPGAVPISDLSGFELPYASEWTVNASIQHVFPLSWGAQIEALLNTQYQSEQWTIFSHAPNSLMNGTSRTDFTLTYRPQGERWSISAWVRNIEDADVLLLGSGPAINATPFPALFTLDAPRTYGVRVGIDL